MQSAPRRSSGPGGGVLLLAVLLGAAGGLAVGLFAYPLLQPPPQPEVVVEDDDPGPLRAMGAFSQLDAQDRSHWGAGGVRLFEREIRLGDDFEVAPGPKYHLYLVPIAGVDPDTRVEESMFVDLGPLSDFAGAQEYRVPTGLRLEDYPSLVVWCEQLNQLVSVARLDKTSTSARAPATSGAGGPGTGRVDER